MEFPDVGYTTWRRAMLETFRQQIDYPLIAPPELGAFIAEDFLAEKGGGGDGAGAGGKEKGTME
ncbi:hypothetical protein HDV00_009755 [Rhizophlyctis rosea]|nr:hypothetical protein HDV00_009755 [Rhizophlyctis rosea]